MKIAVAGTGYVGLSVALLLSQHNEVHALDIIPAKVELLNNGKSPIVDPVITDFLVGNASGERPLDFHATIDAQEAYTDADFAVIATPTNYDEKKNYFDTSSVEAAIAAVRQYSPHAWIVIKSTIPVGYTQQLRKTLNDDHISSRICLPRAQTQLKPPVPIMMAVPVFPRWWSAPPRLRPSNCSPIPI